MNQMTIEELPYRIDTAPLFARCLDLQQPIYLDSCAPYSSRGRYDIFTAEPLHIVRQDQHDHLAVTTGSQTADQSATTASSSGYFSTLRAALDEFTPALDNDYHLPFIGGALGYFGYDLGRQLEQLPTLTPPDLTLPAAAVGIYSWAVIVDHRQQRALLVAHPAADASLLHDIRQRLNSQSDQTPAAFTLNSAFTSTMSRQRYEQAFQAIQEYIGAGDCYQVNLAQRFRAACQGSPWAAYQSLRAVAAAPFSAYMQHGDSAILSVSPERFLHVGNRRVTTSPIKGTIARGNNCATDEKLAQQLLHSPKDRAENLMIVDLLRNDLGKSCTPGSIQVDELFELQSFETVHHLVSTISGQLAIEKDALQLLAGCFPGGSITGAPKVRAMEIIEQLELQRRSVYCGALGYISCDGQMDTNIAIRTMVHQNAMLHCWAGGGIVADSDCESEYQECLSKVAKLFAVLETAI